MTDHSNHMSAANAPSAVFAYERRAGRSFFLDLDAEPSAAAAWPPAEQTPATLWPHVAGPDRPRLVAALKRSAETMTPIDEGYETLGPRGGRRRLLTRPEANAEGHVRVIGLGHDPDFHPAAAFAEQIDLFHAMFEAAPQGVALLDAEQRLVCWSKRFAAASLGSAAPLLRSGVSLDDLDRLAILLGLAEQAAADPVSWLRARRAARATGGGRDERRAAAGPTILAEDRRLPDGGFLCLREDVTTQRQNERRLRAAHEAADFRSAELDLVRSRMEHGALHDELTGLANRRHLEQSLAERLKAAAEPRRRAASEPGACWALHVDLDRFTQINDALGHAAGDEAIVQIARRLREATTPGDLLARIGPDEFVLIPGARLDRAAAERRAAAVLETMRRPVDLDGGQCWIGASIGAAAAGEGASSPASLLRNAGIALSRAKESGRNRCEFFSSAAEREAIERKTIADELRQALDRGEFEVRYQPQLRAATLEVVGVEALVRWRHPRHGVLAPDRFLDLAEQLDLLHAIDAHVMRQALRDVEALRRFGWPSLTVSVNVSAKRLADPALERDLVALAPAPGALTLELIETIFLDQVEDTQLETVARVRAQGVEIEIDDFGTGRASLLGLLKLRPRRLKIDRQLVMPMLERAEERAMVASIADIARALKVEIVAEGVETMRHAELLADLGCHYLQGFAFAAPLVFEDLVALLESPPWLAESDASEPARQAAAPKLAAGQTASPILKPLRKGAR